MRRLNVIVFFFSSRRRHTRFKCDWSSDVCSSDLAGCGWAPYWMERMDDEYAKRAPEAPALKKKPSEYVRSGKIYFSCEADEWLLGPAVKLVGENQIVYASDFPHWDNSYPQSIDEIRDRGDLSDAQKRKILGDNARRLYGLKN